MYVLYKIYIIEMEYTLEELEFHTFEDYNPNNNEDSARFEDYQTFNDPIYGTFEEECPKTPEEWEKIFRNLKSDMIIQFNKEREAFKLQISILERQNKKKEEEKEELENQANKLDARNRELKAENRELKATNKQLRPTWCGNHMPPFLEKKS